MRSRFALIVAGLSTLAGCGGAGAPDTTRALMLGASCYRVPVASLIHFDARTRRYATVWFSNDAVRAAVPGYSIPPALANGMRDTFFVGLSDPNEAEVLSSEVREKTAREETFHDLWYGLDEFSGRIVEPIGGTSLFRVRPLARSATWMVVSRPPDPATRDAHTATDFWIASCAQIDERLDRCNARVDVDGVRMTMYTTEANLALRGLLASYVSDAMKPWQSPCTTGVNERPRETRRP
jgi:hypothetical protein